MLVWGFFKTTSRVLLKFVVKKASQSKIISKANCTFLIGKFENRIRHYSKCNLKKHEINYPRVITPLNNRINQNMMPLFKNCGPIQPYQCCTPTSVSSTSFSSDRLGISTDPLCFSPDSFTVPVLTQQILKCIIKNYFPHSKSFTLGAQLYKGVT